ncbi:aldehyde dehydrogenase [Labedella populi]|uniref:Aldehyde dehydrogenase n=1 Tax=Labedella populi TaxID=2498850 RepID=A0A444QC05_9MICO|nr:aldehyde dehydrogenase family protein [Labedella populi]RWZ61577.1 aldehyde dehydrogenase [Labedella populi]
MTVETTIAAPVDEGRPTDAEVLTVRDPRTGSLVGTLEVQDDAAVRDAVARSRRAFGAWRRTPAAERGAMLHAAASALEERSDEIARTQSSETGKSIDDALGGITAAVGTLHQYAELGPVHRGRSLQGGIEAVDLAINRPRGVVAVLTPWNDPVAITAGLVGAALVTGNTVVHKPSERCPHTGALVNEILAGSVPLDVLIPLVGDGSTGAALVARPEVDAVAHVGSSTTGRAIHLAAAAHDAHVIRENGGNDALIVDAGVDPEWAARQAAVGAFANAGQICTSVERVFVHRDVAGAFIPALVREAEHLVASGALGPLVDERLRQDVHDQVEEALAEGARALTGGRIPDGPGTFYPATVLVDCSPAMAVMSEETFGPVAPIMVVDDIDEALLRAADDRYGLAATVLTPSMATAHRAIAELDVGTVKVNAVFGGAPGGSAQPRRASGAGFGYGPELLDEMTTTTVVHLGLPETAEAS